MAKIALKFFVRSQCSVFEIQLLTNSKDEITLKEGTEMDRTTLRSHESRSFAKHSKFSSELVQFAQVTGVTTKVTFLSAKLQL